MRLLRALQMETTYLIVGPNPMGRKGLRVVSHLPNCPARRKPLPHKGLRQSQNV